jgi:hypothetical protein
MAYLEFVDYEPLATPLAQARARREEAAAPAEA